MLDALLACHSGHGRAIETQETLVWASHVAPETAALRQARIDAAQTWWRAFAREYAVRLVADSAERHRGHIVELLDEVRALAGERRAQADGHLLQRAGWSARRRGRARCCGWLLLAKVERAKAAYGARRALVLAYGRTPGGGRLAARPPDLSVYFFGDLDFACMSILMSLREGFPGASASLHGYTFQQKTTPMAAVTRRNRPARSGKRPST